MKRISFLIALVLSAGSIMAQEHAYEFVGSDENVVPDGSIVTITTAHEAGDGSGDIEMAAGLFAARIDGDSDDLLRIAYDVQTMENGSMQICFPSACKNISGTGTGFTNVGTMDIDRKSIATEWFPADYGKCTVKVSLQTVVQIIGGYQVIDDGPTITLQFVYADPANVGSTVSVATPVAYYSLSGQRLPSRPHGLALVRLSDGRVVKRLLR